MKFRVGQSVGILTGVQSAEGPWIRAIGTVIRTEEFWKGQVDYIVSEPGVHDNQVYPGYLLAEV